MRNWGASTTASRARYAASVDPARLAGILGGALYALSGGVVLATLWLLPDDLDTTLFAVSAAAAIGLGLVLVLAPWGRLPGWMPSGLVLVAHVHLAVSGWLVPGSIEHYLPLYVLAYLYLGMTQPPGTTLVFVPISAVSFAIATSAGTQNTVNFLVAIPVGLICAEILSRLLRLRVRQAADLERVLESTKLLVASTSTDEAARILEELIAGLAGSHGVVVLVACTDQPGHFVGRCLAGGPAQLSPVRVELGSDEGLGSALRDGRSVTIPLTHPVARVPAYLAASGAAAVTYVPLLDGATSLGAIVVTWPRSRPDLDDSTAQMVELVAAEAGPILKGLRDRDRLNLEAETDPLTGLANRRTFNRALDASGEGDALVMIDLDSFKAVNDAHGHAVGDDVLRTLSGCLTSAAREEDCVSRFGGEEFAVILPKAGAAGVRSFLERLRERWTATDPLTTFSAGYAVRGAGEAAVLTLGRADRALYEAKASQRGSDVEAEVSSLADS